MHNDSKNYLFRAGHNRLYVHQPVAHKFFVSHAAAHLVEPQATEHEPMLICKKNKDFKTVPKKNPDAGRMHSLPNQPGKRPFNADDSAKTNWYPQNAKPTLVNKSK